MARGRADGAETRERILAAALPLFADHGFDGASVRDIAGAAGVNVATIAWHFKDKQGLYETLVRVLYDRLGELRANPEDFDGDPIEAIIRRAWRFMVANERYVRLLHRHLLDQGEHTHIAMSQANDGHMLRADELFAVLWPDRPKRDHRLMVFTVLHLLVRLSLESPSQFSKLYATDEDREQVVVRWVSELVRSVLGVRAP